VAHLRQSICHKQEQGFGYGSVFTKLRDPDTNFEYGSGFRFTNGSIKNPLRSSFSNSFNDRKEKMFQQFMIDENVTKIRKRTKF
jgi:hypothetical protein